MRLTVIVPGYNTPDSMWQKCLTSISSAIGEDDEVICVDDGSRIKPNVSIVDNRVRWLYLDKNYGQAYARNKGMELANGDWIAFVDSDDEVVSGVYEAVVRKGVEECSDIVIFGVRTEWIKENLFREVLPCELKGGEEIGNLKLAELVELRLFDVAWNKVYRKSFLLRHGIKFPSSVCPGEDTMFILSCILNRAKWSAVRRIGYIYYRFDGTSLSRFQPNLIYTLSVWKQKWDEFLNGIGKGYNGWWPTREYSNDWVSEQQWKNIWKEGCVLSTIDKWKYLKDHREICDGYVVFFFLKTMVLSFARRHLYIRAIRVWHLKRMWEKDLRVRR